MDKNLLEAFERLFDRKGHKVPSQADADLVSDSLYLDDEGTRELQAHSKNAAQGLVDFLDDHVTYIGYWPKTEAHKGLLRNLAGLDEPKAALNAHVNPPKPPDRPFTILDLQEEVEDPGTAKALDAKEAEETKAQETASSEAPKPKRKPAPKKTSVKKVSKPAAVKKAAPKLEPPPIPTLAVVPIERPRPPAPSRAAEEDLRQKALRLLFDPTSKEFAAADLSSVKGCYRPKMYDMHVLTEEVQDLMQIFADDPDGFIDSIDVITRPDLDDNGRAELKRQFNKLKNFPTAPLTSDATQWIKTLHADRNWQEMRTNIERVFLYRLHTDETVRKETEEHIREWRKHADRCENGTYGPTVINLGRHANQLIRDLESGVDTDLDAYKLVYINT